MFTRAGFPPIEEVQANGRQIRRLLLTDPYMMSAVPGIEVERHRDGHVTLRLQYFAWSGDSVSIDQVAWDALAAIEQEAFAAPAYSPEPVSQRASPPPPAPAICHGWGLWLQASVERRAVWSQCGGRGGPIVDYAMQMLTLAMATRPNCRFERENPFASFSRCFSPTMSLDNPELEAIFAVLRREYYEVAGADRLAEARMALRAPSLTRGGSAWQSARAAIDRYKATNDYRSERLQRLRELASTAVNPSQADRAKMQLTIQDWSHFMQAQGSNYRSLVEQLESLAD